MPGQRARAAAAREEKDCMDVIVRHGAGEGKRFVTNCDVM
jgi:hypothetical protein